MKYFLRVLLVLVISAGIVFGVYYYQNGEIAPSSGEKASLTTVSKPPATEKAATRTLLAKIKKEKLALYKTDDGVLLRLKGKEYTFGGFSSDIEKEKPTLCYADVDSDGEKEILIRAVSGEDATNGKLLYSIYVLNPVKGGFDITMASQDTWFDVLSQYVRIDLKQLGMSKKFLQLAMISKEKAIRYDKKTGVAKNGYKGFARAMQKADGSWAKLSAMEKGTGDFTLDKNGKISVNIELRAKYEDVSELQPFGSIYFEFSVNKENKFYVTAKSMRFIPQDRYRVVPPATKAVPGFSYTLKNSSKADSERELVWIKYSPEIESDTIEQTESLGDESTDIRYADKIQITNDRVVITAKKGNTFGREPASKGEFSVDVTSGEYKGVDIAYSASLNENANVLTIVLDRPYSADMLKNIEISYGSR